ncbi:MAG: hypothetical protein JOZ73_14705, partial [Solirubrobacterales bacterium]|nr:hypothetical protein [Solirubrobacterales bacterium]
MIAFGTAVTNEELYERFARAGIESIAEADALVMVRRGARLQSAYNSMMDEAGARPDLEAVVLLHQDLRVEDLAFNAKVRGALSDPDVALVGALGARGLRGSFLHDAQIVGEVRAQFGDAVMPLRAIVPTGYCDVEAIDGALLILSAWAARNLKFDPLLERDFHGYDLDLSFQARARGRRVVVTDVRAVHDGTGTVGPRRGSLIRALLGLEDKWQPWLASAPRVRTNMPELERVRAEIEGHVRREIRAKRPPLGAAGPPPPVSYHEKRSNRQRWVARWEQHGLDSYAGVPLV